MEKLYKKIIYKNFFLTNKIVIVIIPLTTKEVMQFEWDADSIHADTVHDSIYCSDSGFYVHEDQ